jgi:hypothetical protein
MSLMDMMLSTEPTEQTRDLARAIAAIDRRPSSSGQPIEPPAERTQPRRPSTPAVSTRRALAIIALGGLLIGGVTVLTSHTTSLSGSANAADTPNGAVDNARSGDCLSWPKDSPSAAHVVPCRDEHLFEVAGSGEMHDSQQPCQPAVQRYLGNRYDPNGKFTISVLWPDVSTGTQSAARHVLCGLQLPGPDGKPIAFTGIVAELDQSKVWPAGTCLGIESGQPTGVPVDCSAPHAQEITGTANLAAAWPGTPPSEADQDAFIRDACTRATDAYLSPVTLNTTGLTMIYNTVPSVSWMAGSREVSCGIAGPMGDRGSATLTGAAKGRLLINGAEPASTPQTSPAPAPSPPPPSASPLPSEDPDDPLPPPPPPPGE